MSRRKQAKPRSFKPELESRNTPLAMLPYEPAFLDMQDAASSELTMTSTGPAQRMDGENNAEEHFNPQSPFHNEKQETNDSMESEALGTEPGSTSRSETPDDTQTSPTPSSCATPNSSTDLPDAELTFTVGITEATPYACQFCDKAFPRLSFLKKHEQIHGDHMPFRCEFCSRLFKHKRSRDRHIKLHTGDKKYKCTQCEAAFSRSDHLKIHMKTHDTQKPFQCTVCNRGYNTAAALTSHMQNHKRQRPETPSASVSGNNSNSARTVVNSEESMSSPDMFHCSQCGDSFKKQEYLQTHIMNVHTPNMLSPEETSRKSAPLALPDHILPQLTPKLACIYCTKDSFTTMEQLQLHVQAMHSSILNGELREFSLGRQTPNISPHDLLTPPPPLIPVNGLLRNNALVYQCSLCTMRFPTIHRLRKHSLTVHGSCDFTKDMNDSVAPTPLICVQCSLPFHTSAAFTEHYLMVHAGSSPSVPAASPVAEQVRPTDLSRKTPRPTSDDRNAKRMCVNEDGANRLDLMTPNQAAGQYEYPNMLLCNQCDAALPDFESFRNHLKSHLEQSSGVRSFVLPGTPTVLDGFQQDALQKIQNNCICPHCGAAFKDIVSCEQHIFAHFLSTAVEYGCQSCLKMFSKLDELQKHLMEHHAHHIYRCALCKEMFDSKVAIQVHFAVKHCNECKLYRCTACPNTVSIFHTELEFSLHVRTVHGAHALLPSPQTHSKGLRCMFCRQVFGTDLEMQFHLATHTKQFRCPICAENFQIEFLLDRHMQTYHSNARNLNGEVDETADGERTNKKSSSSPHQAGKSHASPGRTSQKSTSGDNNNVKKQHEVSQLNNCDICERNDFSNETELVAHRKLVHHARNSSKNGVVSLHCAYCNENCKTRTELENHMKSHSQSSGVSGKHKCNICDEICPSAVLLAEHKLTHCKVISGNCCTQCKASITTEELFYSHLVLHSNNNNNQKSKSQVALPTPCVICRQTLISDIEVRIHTQFHLRNTMLQAEYQCASCFKLIDVQSIILCSGNYMCSECYTITNNTPPQNYSCTECQFSFESSIALDRHVDAAHTKTYTCIKCQAFFDNERDVQIHVATHLMAEENNHECHLCRRLFATALKLQAHLIEHTFAGCGGFTCYLCSAVFTGASGLQHHIIEHGLQARPYDCAHCSLKFFFRAELDNHSYSHLGRSSRSANVDVDTSMLSPKSFYMAINAKNGDLSKYYVKEPKSKKLHKTDGNEVQTKKNGTDNGIENNENHIVKEEPKDDLEEKREEYVEVDFPTGSNMKKEQNPMGENSLEGETPNVINE